MSSWQLNLIHIVIDVPIVAIFGKGVNPLLA